MRKHESTECHTPNSDALLRRQGEDIAGPAASASHESVLRLQRSAGNESVQRLLVQRQDPPGAGSSLALGGRSRGFSLLGGEQLHLDPEIEAQANAYRARMELERILHPPDILSAIRETPLTLAPPPNQALLTTPPATPDPLVPRGAGPDTARDASGGDLMGAIAAVPSVDRAITRLRTQALTQVSRDWSRLTTGDRVLLITTSVLIAGGALAGVGSDPQARRFVLDQVNGRELGVPGVDGLSVTFNTRPENLGVMFTYDLGPLISRATGM